MKLICPSCGAVHSAEAWQNDAQARQCLLIVAELPTEVSRRAVAYIGLFRPLSGRGLQWSRALRLLAELKDLVVAPHVQWDGKPARPNSNLAWSQAMEQIIQHPPRRMPLSSHGYLHSIAYERAEEIDRGIETRRNAAERSGNPYPKTEDAGPAPLPVPILQVNATSNPEEAEAGYTPDFSAIRAAIRKVGKKI